MHDDDFTADNTDDTTAISGELTPAPAEPELPERLRVHSLARVLGTTSRKVLDALVELDGRARSAHSGVDREEAVRVRDLLAAAETLAEEPESRLMLETPPAETQPVDVPLFVAPQPIVLPPTPEPADDAAADVSDAVEVEETDDIDTEDADTEGTDADADAEGGEDDAEGGDADAEGGEDEGARPANRRRRRGRRGRGRGRGGEAGADEGEETDGEGAEDTGADSDEAEADAEGDEDEDAEGEEGAEGGEGATKRRRRRRRRKSGAVAADDSDAGSPDDPPNTVVHERVGRRSGKGDKDPDEIQGITGSTRLEAKRQRRRDGRDAGRRRPPILSEAEFLARREAVDRVMVVRDKVRTEPPHEGARYTQIAVLEDGIVVEHFVTSAASASLVGNVYLGIVQNVLPSMEAAFVDIGRGRNGVLYAGEVNWEAAGLGGANRKIEQALKPGDYVVVQVSKDPVGHKGARLTTQISLAGRYLVYVPGASSTGISRKLPDTERQRLKEILREVVPADAGVIIRTASEGVKESDIRTDVARLQERWAEIEATAAQTTANAAGAAVALYEEPDVLVKVIRDLFNEDFSGLTVQGESAWETIDEYVSSVAPELVSKVTKYEPVDGGPDVFAVHRIDEQLTKAMDRKVWLPSGGTLVIDRTEAMTVVDVNTGKFTGAGGNLEQTVTKNNLEAAEEVVRQLRLRDIGGIVVIDFIDMVLESNRDLVLRRLTEALGRDRTRHQVSEVTSLGLVQLTRKRLGTGLVEAFSTTCTHCAGRGIVLHADPVDSAPPAPRKTENRRNRRARKPGKVEETPVAKIPAHSVGDHPMFKAMAHRHGDEDEDGESVPVDDDDETPTAEEQIVEAETAEQVTEETAAADLDDEDDVEADEEEIDLDGDDDEEDDDLDDIDLVDGDADDEDADEDSEDEDSDEDDLDEDDSDEDDDGDEDDEDLVDDDTDGDDEDDAAEPEPVDEAVNPAPERPRRRRAAARPAGPPVTG